MLVGFQTLAETCSWLDGVAHSGAKLQRSLALWRCLDVYVLDVTQLYGPNHTFLI